MYTHSSEDAIMHADASKAAGAKMYRDVHTCNASTTCSSSDNKKETDIIADVRVFGGCNETLLLRHPAQCWRRHVVCMEMAHLRFVLWLVPIVNFYMFVCLYCMKSVCCWVYRNGYRIPFL